MYSEVYNLRNTLVLQVLAAVFAGLRRGTIWECLPVCQLYVEYWECKIIKIRYISSWFLLYK